MDESKKQHIILGMALDTACDFKHWFLASPDQMQMDIMHHWLSGWVVSLVIALGTWIEIIAMWNKVIMET